MNAQTLMALSFGMSMDAFAASISQGSTLEPLDHKKMLFSALRVGTVFGVVEAMTCVVGYFLGVMAEDWVSRFDHWVSFVLLGGIGLHLIYGSLFGEADKTIKPKLVKNTAIMTVITAIATGIDSMIVGVSLAFLGVNIWFAATMIGIFTTVMATFGVCLGRRLGERIGKLFEILGGLVLIGIGVFILLSHLGVMG